MLCERALELLSDYHEGIIQPAMRVPLENHLESCAACSKELDGLNLVWKSLANVPVVEPPVEFRAAVWRRIDEDIEARQRTRRPLFSVDWRSLFARPAMAWAATLALAALVSSAVVPGVYKPAAMWFPWSLFSTRAPQPAPAVTIGKARVVADPAGSVLKVPISNPGSKPLRVEFDITGGVVAQKHVTMTIPAGQNGLVPVTAVLDNDPANPLKVDVHWTQAGP